MYRVYETFVLFPLPEEWNVDVIAGAGATTLSSEMKAERSGWPWTVFPT